MDLSRYRRFLGTPGVPRLFTSVLVGRLPAGMLSLAIVLRITGAGGTYALAGAVTAAYTFGVGVSAPLISRLVDRRGQPVVLIPTALATVAATIVLAALPPDGSRWALIAAGAAVGIVLPPVSVSSRALWPSVITDAEILESAYAVDATFQELIFIVGPLLVVAVNAVLGGAASVIASGLLCASGSIVFATSRASRRWRPVPHHERRGHALRSPGIRVLLVTMLCVVGSFGVVDVSTVAAARHGSGNGAAGALLAIWAGGSFLGGLLYGGRRWPGTLTQRLLVLLAATTALTAAMAAASAQLLILGVVMLLSGMCCAPAFSGVYSTAQRVALPGVVTESYAWLATGSMVGVSIGSALGGTAITRHGAAAGYAVATIGAALGLLTVAVGRRALRSGAEPNARGSDTGSPDVGIDAVTVGG